MYFIPSRTQTAKQPVRATPVKEEGATHRTFLTKHMERERTKYFPSVTPRLPATASLSLPNVQTFAKGRNKLSRTITKTRLPELKSAKQRAFQPQQYPPTRFAPLSSTRKEGAPRSFLFQLKPITHICLLSLRVTTSSPHRPTLSCSFRFRDPDRDKTAGEIATTTPSGFAPSTSVEN